MRSAAGVVTGLLLAAYAAGCGSTTTVIRTTTVTRTVPSTLSASGDQRIYGRITSLQRKGNRYELRFDPAWLVGGVTANVAQAEDAGTACQPSACPAVRERQLRRRRRPSPARLHRPCRRARHRPCEGRLERLSRDARSRRRSSRNWSPARGRSSCSSRCRRASGSSSIRTPSARSHSSTTRSRADPILRAGRSGQRSRAARPRG